MIPYVIPTMGGGGGEDYTPLSTLWLRDVVNNNSSAGIISTSLDGITFTTRTAPAGLPGINGSRSKLQYNWRANYKYIWYCSGETSDVPGATARFAWFTDTGTAWIAPTRDTITLGSGYFPFRIVWSGSRYVALCLNDQSSSTEPGKIYRVYATAGSDPLGPWSLVATLNDAIFAAAGQTSVYRPFIMTNSNGTVIIARTRAAAALGQYRSTNSGASFVYEATTGFPLNVNPSNLNGVDDIRFFWCMGRFVLVNGGGLTVYLNDGTNATWTSKALFTGTAPYTIDKCFAPCSGKIGGTEAFCFLATDDNGGPYSLGAPHFSWLNSWAQSLAGGAPASYGGVSNKLMNGGSRVYVMATDNVPTNQHWLAGTNKETVRAIKRITDLNPTRYNVGGDDYWIDNPSTTGLSSVVVRGKL